jgi:hypothetical protein
MGNMHAAHPVTHTLTDVSQAQYIRIVPLSWKNNICMRFELFGCVAGQKCQLCLYICIYIFYILDC